MRAHRMLASVAVAAAFAPAVAASPGNQGYLVDNRNVIVTSGTGQCWHTNQWSSALAVEPCDPVRRAAMAPAAPKPAPEPQVQQAAPAPAPVPPPRRAQQRVDLSADTLFAFDQAALRPEGKSVLEDFARQLSAVKYDAIMVVGHADRIGDDEYNRKLSERRASAVKEYLASEANVPGDRISVDAKGSAEPVTRAEDCRGRGPDVVACLAPDRRVHVEVAGTREVTSQQ